MAINLFDFSYYRLANPDLARAGLTTDTQLSSHFQTFGLNEGRSFSPVVDLNLYRNFNPDLDAAGIKTNQQLLTHLQNSGVAEGRRFSEFVDLDFYLQANQDVRQAFQGNREQSLLHLLNSGVREGRKFSPFVDVNFYLANNTDVNAAFGGDRFQSLRHLVNSGVKEGRIFSPFVDLNLYKTFNSDLKNLDNTQAFQNLVTIGVGEGRQFSHTLDLSYYGFYNPDLITAYAVSKNLRTEAALNNPTELASLYNFLLRDFELNGISQGRRASDEFDVTYYRARNQDLANLSNQQLYEHFRSNGIKELRKFSDSYDALYYQNFNSAPNGFNIGLQQLYEYYITTGLNEGDIATSNPKFTDEVVSDFDLISGNTSINNILNTRSDPNPDRPGSYADTYLLSGLDPGQQVQINMRGNYDTYLQLVDAVTGEVIAENDNISTTDLNSRINFTVDPFTYYILRASSVDARALGFYTLTGQASSTIVGNIAANGGSLAANLSNTDLLNPDGTGTFKRDYRLDLTGVNPEQKIKLNLDSSELDAYLEVIDADTKETIGVNDDADEQTLNSELYFVVEPGVNYAVRVSSFDAEETGNFALSASALADPPISRAQTIAATFNPGGNPDTYDLDLTGINPGDRIRVNVISAQFNTFLRVVPSNGAPIDNDNAITTSHSEITFTVAPNTTYQFQVTRSGDDKLGAGKYTITTTPLTGAGSTFTLSDPGLQSIIAGKENVERSDILALFDRAKADGVISTTEQKDFKKLADNAVRLRIRNYVKFGIEKVNEALPQNSNTTPDILQQAVDRWFLGKVPPSPQYVGKGDTARGPAAKEIKNVTHLPIQGNLFGNDPDGTIRGINQGGLGNCAFLAAVAATFATPQFEGNENTSSATVKQMLRDNGDGTYTFRFFDNGDPFYVTVDRSVATEAINNSSFNSLPFANKGGAINERQVDAGNGFIYDSRDLLQGDGNSIWIPLLERAYAQFRELTADARFRQVTGDNGGYSLIGNGDNVTDPLERMTGRKATTYGLATNPATNDFITLYNFDTQRQATFEDVANALTQGRALEVGTEDKLPNFPSDLLVGSHAYAVTRAYLDSGNNPRVVVRNPWGVDGGDKPVGNVNDGFIDLSFEQFRNGFDEMAIA